MTGWRLMMAGLMTCALLGARPASAKYAFQDEGSTSDDVSTFEDSVESADTWSTIGWGALTGLANLVYVPVKLTYAGLGGLTGGLALGLTGGDVNTAQGIWNPSLGGDYFLTQGMVQGDERFSFTGTPAAGVTGTLPDDPAPSADTLVDPHFGS